jgi:hypothetical protein
MVRQKYINFICIQFSTKLSTTCPLNTHPDFLDVIFSPVNWYLTWLMFFGFCPSHLDKKPTKTFRRHPFSLGRWTLLKILATSTTVHHLQHSWQLNELYHNTCRSFNGKFLWLPELFSDLSNENYNAIRKCTSSWANVMDSYKIYSHN